VTAMISDQDVLKRCIRETTPVCPECSWRIEDFEHPNTSYKCRQCGHTVNEETYDEIKDRDDEVYMVPRHAPIKSGSNTEVVFNDGMLRLGVNRGRPVVNQTVGGHGGVSTSRELVFVPVPREVTVNTVKLLEEPRSVDLEDPESYVVGEALKHYRVIVSGDACFTVDRVDETGGIRYAVAKRENLEREILVCGDDRHERYMGGQRELVRSVLRPVVEV